MSLNNSELEIQVALEKIRFVRREPCQTVYGIAKAIFLKEAVEETSNQESTLERIMRLIWQEIARLEDTPKSVDVARIPNPLDLVSMLNLYNVDQLIRLRERVEKYISRLRFSVTNNDSTKVSPRLIEEFFENLFVFVALEKDRGNEITMESVLAYMRQDSIENFALLIEPYADFANEPLSMDFGNLIVEVTTNTSTIVFYDIQPFLDQFKELSDPDDVTLLFEANQAELKTLSENQQFDLLRQLLDTYEHDSERTIIITIGLLKNLEQFSWPITILLNECLREVVDLLIFKESKDSESIALSTLLLASEKAVLIPSLLQETVVHFSVKYAHSVGRIKSAVEQLITFGLLTQEWWDELLPRIEAR